MNALMELYCCEDDDFMPRDTNNHVLRILVVEDDAFVRELNSDILSQSGYVVDTAEDGDAGLNAALAIPYDLIITDNNMPKLSGVQLVARLRAENSTVPIILASGAIPSAAEELSLSAILPKPYLGQQLVEMVQAIIGVPHPV